ncbi:hypothetical protein LEP1GSC163_1040 [Leptospira santarosai str. CBC379]|nr:hypothetical protein LEP1GSC163_1040 [Leptospira santarosai str. CBC379]
MVSENNKTETKNKTVHLKGILKDLNFIPILPWAKNPTTKRKNF